MDQFNQAQAAHLSGWEERPFRTLVERLVIIPTPETRRPGRGKAKNFDHFEVKIASILSRIPGLTPYQMPTVADWLRHELAQVERSGSEKYPHYVLFEHQPDGGWRGELPRLLDHGRLDVRVPNADDEVRPSPAFSAVNIPAALWWCRVSDDFLEQYLEEALSE